MGRINECEKFEDAKMKMAYLNKSAEKEEVWGIMIEETKAQEPPSINKSVKRKFLKELSESSKGTKTWLKETAKQFRGKGKTFLSSANLYDINNLLDENRAVDHARMAWSKTLEFKIFLLITALFMIADPFLSGYKASHWFVNYDGNQTFAQEINFDENDKSFDRPLFIAQFVVICISWFLFLYGFFRTVSYVDVMKFPSKSNIFLKMWCCWDMEVIFEFLCLCDACMIVYGQGYAVLRIVRPFRLFWYSELFNINTTKKHGEYSLWILNPLKSAHLVLLYLRRIFLEIFTAKSRGGIFVILLFLYISFAVAITFVETQGALHSPDPFNLSDPQLCVNLSACFFTILRLAFYDGNGFDFLQAVSIVSPKQAVALIIYLFFASTILLNGLIDIFGNSFKSQVEFELEEEEASRLIKKKRKKIIQRKLKEQELKERKEKSVRVIIAEGDNKSNALSPRETGHLLSSTIPKIDKTRALSSFYSFDDANSIQSDLLDYGDDEEMNIASLIRILREEIKSLSIKVDALQNTLMKNNIIDEAKKNINIQPLEFSKMEEEKEC